MKLPIIFVASLIAITANAIEKNTLSVDDMADLVTVAQSSRAFDLLDQSGGEVHWNIWVAARNNGRFVDVQGLSAHVPLRYFHQPRIAYCPEGFLPYDSQNPKERFTYHSHGFICRR